MILLKYHNKPQIPNALDPPLVAVKLHVTGFQVGYLAFSSTELADYYTSKCNYSKLMESIRESDIPYETKQVLANGLVVLFKSKENIEAFLENPDSCEIERLRVDYRGRIFWQSIYHGIIQAFRGTANQSG